MSIALHSIKKEGYEHDYVCHKNYNWKKGEVSTNAIEAHWSVIKDQLEEHMYT